MTSHVVVLSSQEANESLNFDEQILEAAKSIAGATAALVKAASAAQQELVSQGRIGQYNGETDDDSQWSQGLVSAVRQFTPPVPIYRPQ